MGTIIANTHSEWLQSRTSGIGSSEVPSILGISPFETAYQLWLRKTGQLPQKAETPQMRAGHLLEDTVARLYADAAGATIEQGSEREIIEVSDNHPFMRVSPDRYFTAPAKPGRRILECKTTQLDIDPDDFPAYWYAQLQYQLYVANCTGGAVAWLTRGYKFGYKEFVRNDDYCAYLAKAVTDFWTINVMGGTAPAPTNGDDFAHLYPSHTDGKEIEATAEIEAAIVELKAVKALLKETEEHRDALENKLRIYMCDAERLVNGKGRTYATLRNAKDSVRFDMDTFKREQPEIFAYYQKSVAGSRRLIIK